jgi:glycosyltransferase involved in cell wall biosynthesis
MKRILFITAFVPSKIGAGENFSRQLINDLSPNNKIDLIFFKYSENDDYVVESKNVNVLRVFKNSALIKFINYLMFPWVFPLFSVRFNFFRLLFIKRVLRRNRYDLIFFDFSQTFLFAKFIFGIPLILNSHDVIYQRYSRIQNGFFVPFIRFSEKFVLNNKFSKIFTHSEKDRFLIRQIYSLESTVSSVYLDNSVINSQPRSEGDYFVFFANWSRSDNSDGLRWFLKSVLPLLDKNFSFRIIGSGLSGDLLSEFRSYPNFEYMGFIEDPYPVISNAKALLSPLFTGAGIKVKVIESLACGTPVIGTDVSFEGISETYSQFLVNAGTSEEFISAIRNFEFDFSRKQELKDLFINSYQNKTISVYINSL